MVEFPQGPLHVRDDRNGFLSLCDGDDPWVLVGVDQGSRQRVLAEQRLKLVKRLVERERTKDGEEDDRDAQINDLTRERDELRARVDELNLALERSEARPAPEGESMEVAYRGALEEIRGEGTTNVRKAKLIAEQALGGSVEGESDAVENEEAEEVHGGSGEQP